MAFGAVLGGQRAVRAMRLKWLGDMQTGLLFLIVFSLGVQLGANEEVTASLSTIGISALLIAVLATMGSVLFLAILRVSVLRLDRRAASEHPYDSERAEEETSSGALLSWIILAAVLLGYFLGRYALPAAMSARCGAVVSIGLNVMLFLVGLDLGRQGEAIASIRAAGWRALLVPLSVVLGSVLFGALAGAFLPFSPRETAAAAAGLGWYSLAPTILAPYSLKLSAAAFLSNVLREVFCILLIPTIARRLGFLECVAAAGATAMDTVFPVILQATDRHVAVYAFVSGLICSLLVPVLVPILAGI